ncbi:N-acetylmuramoyl-L-alanine amidase [Bacillus sp. JCM 19041]|uniref:N-acetylmuramoyl-L-alanine amidase family protein n=1 Tax=Bacillus sp. JCM 19041 TaxID=1460637 RepID=UPI0006D1A636
MEMKRVILDPSHGGSDVGDTGFGVNEKDVTLLVAKATADALMGFPVEVMLTREVDRFLSEDARIRMANEWNSDLYVSIHVNGGNQRGFESYVYHEASQEAKQMQVHIHREVTKRMKFSDLGLKEGVLGQLQQAKMPAVLTKTFFIDNLEEGRRLRDRRVIQMMALSHANGIIKALGLDSEMEDVPMYRVHINGHPVGAYQEVDSLVREVTTYYGKAKSIRLELV